MLTRLFLGRAAAQSEAERRWTKSYQTPVTTYRVPVNHSQEMGTLRTTDLFVPQGRGCRQQVLAVRGVETPHVFVGEMQQDHSRRQVWG